MSEVAAALELSTRQVYRLIGAGTLPSLRDDRGVMIVPEVAVAGYASAR